MKQASPQRGFTVIELMITVAIIAVVATIGVPMLTQTVAKNTVNSQQRNFRVALQEARSIAVSRTATVVMCPSSDQASCNGPADWNSGWIVFIDRDGDGTVTAGDELVKVHEGFGDNTSLTPSTAVAFTSQGFVSGLATLTYTLCHDNNEARYAREISVGPSGIVRVSRDTDGDGVHNNDAGNLSCSA